MELLIAVSRLPPTIAVTVTVKGEPAIALEGMAMLRVAYGVPQPNVTNPATAVLSTQSLSVASAVLTPRRADVVEDLVSMRAKSDLALDTLPSPDTRR